MSTALSNSPTQAEAAEWEANRIGRFTASVIGKLMMEPKSISEAFMIEHAHLVDIPMYTPLKSGPRKGSLRITPGFADALKEACEAAGVPIFGDTARGLIASKAAERLGQRPAPTNRTRSMDRGSLLEHAARILLSRYWKPINGVTFQPYGNNSGATPDGIVVDTVSSWQVKCPEDPGDLMLFADSVQDGDFDALKAWNPIYAWQCMMEAKATGCKTATFTMFTDRLDTHKITPLEREEVQIVMDSVAYAMGEQLNYPIFYKYESDGFAHVTRHFELTEERSKRIDQVLEAAEVECQRFMALMS